jgi:hypothetical protein
MLFSSLYFDVLRNYDLQRKENSAFFLVAVFSTSGNFTADNYIIPGTGEYIRGQHVIKYPGLNMNINMNSSVANPDPDNSIIRRK